MQSKVKLTKRQVKEDKFTTFMLVSKDQFQDNWQMFVAGLAFVIVIVAGIGWWLNNQATTEVNAQEKFSQAMMDLQRGDKQLAIMGFTQIVDDFGQTDVATQATFMLGSVNLSLKNYADAAMYFEMSKDKYKDNHLNRAASFAGIAAVRENEGNYSEAAIKFNEAYQENPAGPLAGDYLLGAIRVYLQAGDMQAAKNKLEILESDFVNSDFTVRANRLYYEKNKDS